MLVPLTVLSLVLATDSIDVPKTTWKPLSFDYFMWTCRSALAENAVITTACPDTLMEPDYANYWTCLVENDYYTPSLYNCIKISADRLGLGGRAVADSWEEYIKTCKEYGNVKPKYTLREVMEYVQQNPITLSFQEANDTLTGPFQPDMTVLTDSLIQSGNETHWNYYLAELFGMIQMWYFFGICFIQACIHWGGYLLPSLIRVISNNPLSRQLRRHIVLPAMFGKSRSDPVKFLRIFLLSFPPRLHTIFFIGFLFINILGDAYHYHVILNPYWYYTRPNWIGAALAYRSGQLAMYKMPLVFLLAGRNNILIWLTGWQMEIFNHWHRWLARLFAIDVVIHSIAYSIDFVNIDYYTISFADAYFNWGIVATVMVCLLCLNGTKSLRVWCYEFFLYLHILMAVFSVIGTYYHVIGMAGFELIWPCIAFWGFDRVIRLTRIILSNPFAKAHVIAHPYGVLEVTVKYSGFWKPVSGTYVFIHFLSSPLYSFQSHPFTIVSNGTKGEFKLYCKVLNGVTRQLYKRAEKNGGEVDTRVLVEGPYGVEFPVKPFQEIVLFAGGVGITAVYSHAMHIASQNTPGQLITLHWAVSNSDPLTWFKKELSYLATFANINVVVHMNDSPSPLVSTIEPNGSMGGSTEKKDATSDHESIDNVSIHRVTFAPDFNLLLTDHISNSQGSILIFVCGPPAMSDAIRAGVTENLLKTKNYVQFYEESFSM